MGLSLSRSASSSHGRLGFGPARFGAVGSKDVFSSSSLSSSESCWSRGRFSDERKMSLGVRFWGGAVTEPPEPLAEGVSVPYERDRDGLEVAVVIVAGGDGECPAECSFSGMVAGTWMVRYAEASSSAEYSLSSSWGMVESSSLSMYRYCSMSSFVRL